MAAASEPMTHLEVDCWLQDCTVTSLPSNASALASSALTGRGQLYVVSKCWERDRASMTFICSHAAKGGFCRSLLAMTGEQGMESTVVVLCGLWYALEKKRTNTTQLVGHDLHISVINRQRQAGGFGSSVLLTSFCGIAAA